MKKIIYSMLIAGTLAITTAGCGNTAESTGNSNGATSQTAEETSDTVEEESDKAENSSKAPVEIDEFDKSATIEETILIDQDDIKVAATELSFTDYSAVLSISIENNSGEDLSFIANSLRYSCNAINGYMVSDGYMNEDVAAGKKANTTISFDLEGLQMYGINSIADIELGIYTTDADYDSTDYDPVKIMTSAADGYDFDTDTYKEVAQNGIMEALTDGEVNYWNSDQIYSEENVSIESVMLFTNKKGEQSFFIEFANASDQRMHMEISSVALNDLVLDGGLWSSDTVNSGAIGISDIRVDSLIDENYQNLLEIGDITSLSFNLVLQDSNYDDITEAQSIRVELSENPVTYEVSGQSVVDSNGIKLTQIGIVEDGQSYTTYAYKILYAVENGTDDAVRASCDYNSLSINGFMLDYYDFSGVTPAGMTGLLEINVYKEDVESAGITSVEDIQEVEFNFIVKDLEYNTLVEETVVESE